MAEFVVPRALAPVRGTFPVPASKSLAQRALVLAALAEGATDVVMAGPVSDDVHRLAAALGTIAGREMRLDAPVPSGWSTSGLGGSRRPIRLDLGMNATGFRFLVALAGLRPSGARALVTGRPRLLARPHGPLLRALDRLGAHVRRRHSGSVRVISTPWRRHEVDVRGEASSQYTSALLLAAPRAGGLRVRTGADAVSRGYVALTIDVLRAFRVPVERRDDAIVVAEAAPTTPRFVVEPDASSAAVWWTAAALTGGRAVVPGVSRRSIQPDAALLGVLERMGARVGDATSGACVEGPTGGLSGAGDVDLRDAPDLAPLVAVLGAAAAGETRIVHAAHLRWKESDRIVSLVAGLRAVGADVAETADGFRVRGGVPLRGGIVRVEADHRLVLAFGVLGLAVAGITLSDTRAVAKSYPEFTRELERRRGSQNPSRRRSPNRIPRVPKVPGGPARMRPTFTRATIVLAVLCGVIGSGIAARAGDEAPPWDRAIRGGIADQDAEIARSSAKAVATRLASQASRNRTDLVIHYLLARAFGKDNQRADAISAYGEALAIEPRCWYAWRDRGVVRWLEKDLKGAEADLRQAIALNPRMLDALQPLGALLIEEKRYSEGIKILTLALNVDPALDSARVQIADAFLALGVPENALQTLAPLLSKSPRDVMLRVTRAKYLIAKKEFAEAQRIFKQLALENPTDPAPLKAWLGIAVESKQIDPDEAIWVLEQLRRLARTADERTKLSKQIEDLRRQVAAASAPPAPAGPPTPELLVRALRAPDIRAREAAAAYILLDAKSGFTITGDLLTALIERLVPAEPQDAPAKGENSARIRAFVLEILSKYGTPDFASIVRPSLKDPDGNVRRKAADALGQLANPLAIAALWRYATGTDLDLAVSARYAIYQLAKKVPPSSEPTPDAESTAFKAWWESSEARDVKLTTIAAILASPDRALDELLFPFAYLDADDAVGTLAYKGLKSLQRIADVAAAEAAKAGKPVPAGIEWMRSLPALDAPPVVEATDNGHGTGVADPAANAAKPFHDPALAAWWLRRPK